MSPYIAEARRRRLDGFIDNLAAEVMDEAGELNYSITRLLWAYWRLGPRYYRIVFVMGTLVCVGLEIYRRIFVPYEEAKMAQEGDVYQ